MKFVIYNLLLIFKKKINYDASFIYYSQGSKKPHCFNYVSMKGMNHFYPICNSHNGVKIKISKTINKISELQ